MASNTQDDVATLWQRAIDNYNNNPDLRSLKDMPRVDNLNTLDDIAKLREKQAKSFLTSRNDGGKVSWLRTKIKSCLGPIDSIANYLAGAASTTFPPASAVYTVVSYLIETATRVTHDYDTVENFFGKMEEFLTRLSILKDDIPKETVLQEHLVKILEAFLTLCGISTKYIAEKRFKRFLSDLFHEGGDEKLAEAYSKMLKLVDEESRIVANTILKIVQRISSNVELGIDISLRGAATAERTEILLLEERKKLELDRNANDTNFEIVKAMLAEVSQKLQQGEPPARWGMFCRVDHGAESTHLGFGEAGEMIGPEPSRAPFIVPFPRDADDFVNRHYITKIAKGFESHHQMALYGLGGTGKSRIAIEYLYRLRELQPQRPIFWVYAAGEPQFRSSYVSISEKIPKEFKRFFDETQSARSGKESEDGRTDTLALVQLWLQSEQSGQWLMILDNADDPEFFLQSGSTKPWMKKYIPRSNRGHLLITSRRKDVALSLVSGAKCLIHVEIMAQDEAKHLFRKLLSEDSASDETILMLSRALGFLPLAIKQAAAYIISNSFSIEGYFCQFSENEDNQQELLGETFEDLTRDTDASNAVVLTLQMSFNQIKTKSTTAGNMMALVATFNREGIHEFMLKYIWQDKIQFTHDIGLLLGFSLISRNADRNDVFSMHRLVQMIIRRCLLRKEEKILWEKEALRVLFELFQDAMGKHQWADCQVLHPHVQVVTHYTYSDDSTIHTKDKLSQILWEYEHPPLAQLSSLSSSRTYESTLHTQCFEGPSQWLFHVDIFQHWQHERQGLLLLFGGPGAGKTMLCSSVIRYLKNNYSEDDVSVLYFFFSFDQKSKNPTSDFFRDLIFQLCVDLKPLPDKVRTLLSQPEAADLDMGTPELIDILLMAATLLRKNVFIVVDALDECQEDSQRTICDALSHLTENDKDVRFHVLLSSRFTLETARMSEKHRMVDLSHYFESGGIEDFIKEQVISRKLGSLDFGLDSA